MFLKVIYEMLVRRGLIKALHDVDNLTEMDLILYFNNNDITVHYPTIAGAKLPIVRKRGRDVHLFKRR